MPRSVASRIAVQTVALSVIMPLVGPYENDRMSPGPKASHAPLIASSSRPAGSCVETMGKKYVSASDAMPTRPAWSAIASIGDVEAVARGVPLESSSRAPTIPSVPVP